MPKIIMALQGGLGNQMFQYAAGKAAALRTGADLLFDFSWLIRWREKLDTSRDYELHHFPALVNLQSADFKLCGKLGLIDHFDLSLSGKFNRCLSRAVRCLTGRKSFICDPGYYLELSKQTLQGDVYLDGYWQSERYFADIAEVIRTDFTFPAMTGSRNLELSKRILESHSPVSLHVRRGDYVNNAKTAKFHGGICSMEYYQKAVQMIQGISENPLFVVFSDDPSWVRINFTLPPNTVYVDWNSGSKSFQDMQLMASCSHHIIANSSFSWWGAWLGRNPEKTVIAPARWFNGDLSDGSGVVPEQWIKIADGSDN